jgi:hypothetical protein
MSWAIAGRYVRAAATDPDAQAYLQAVEAADGQALEFEVARAIDNFVLGCKADGIWPAIKASCILAGARTLAGALVPLVGAAPTNVDGLFVSGDYNRKTGLMGDGSTKYLDSNRNNNADPQNSNHNSAYVFASNTSTGPVIGTSAAAAGHNNIFLSIATNRDLFTRSRSGTLVGAGTGSGALLKPSLFGASRAFTGEYQVRAGNVSSVALSESATPVSETISLYRRGSLYLADSIAFYSIGESLDLALLDARVTTLINAFDAAI